MYITMNVRSILEIRGPPILYPQITVRRRAPARSKCSPAHLADAGPRPQPPAPSPISSPLYRSTPGNKVQKGGSAGSTNRLRSERDCQMRLLDGKNGVGRDQYKRATSVLVTADDSTTEYSSGAVVGES